MYTYFLLELVLVMSAAAVAQAVHQFELLLNELELLKHDSPLCDAYASDPEPRVPWYTLWYGNLTDRGCAWVKRVASPGIV
jgi:hypothetical protein